MARSIDEIIALHIGGLALEMCKQVKRREELQDEVHKLKVELSLRPDPVEELLKTKPANKPEKDVE